MKPEVLRLPGKNSPPQPGDSNPWQAAVRQHPRTKRNSPEKTQPGHRGNDEISRPVPSELTRPSRNLESLAGSQGGLPFAKSKCPRSRLCESRALLHFDVGKILHLERLAKLFFCFSF